MSWFVFAIHFLIPITDASGSATRTKRDPRAATVRGDTAVDRGGNDDGEEGGKGDREEGKGQ